MSSKLSALGKRKLGKKAPITVALSEQIEEAKPKEKEFVDISVIVDYYLWQLPEDDFKALYKLACMPFEMLISLLQVMNNPGVKESVAHLPIWKQVQFGLRQFCVLHIPGKLWSKRDNEIWRSGLPDSTNWTEEYWEENRKLCNRRRVKALRGDVWFSRYWDKGIGDSLWFIEHDWINYWFFEGKNIFDPTINYEGKHDYHNDYFFDDSSYDVIDELLQNMEELSEQEIQVTRAEYLRYCFKTNWTTGNCNSMADSSVNIPPQFVPTKYEHLAESSGYLKAKYLIPNQYQEMNNRDRPIPSPAMAIEKIRNEE